MILMTAAMILLPASIEKYAETQVASVKESLPDTRPEILMAAIKKSPGWDGVNPEWMEFTGQAGTLIGGPVSELTKESGWTKEMADRRVSEALKQLADGFQVRVQPSHSPLRKTGVRFYITNPVIVGNLAFVEIDYVLTAAHTRVFEWRGRWVPVATLLGPVF